MAFDDDMIKRKTPLQVLNKSPNYFRRNSSSQPQKRSASAAEQLFEGTGMGENHSSSNVLSHRLEYFNKNKKGLLDGRKTAPAQDDRRKEIQDDTSLFEATRRSRKLQEQREKMHRARSVERPYVKSRLVLTSFPSDESLDEGNDIPSDLSKVDSLNDIPSGRVFNRISFFSKTDRNVSKKSSAIEYQDLQKVTAETPCNTEKRVSMYSSKPSHPVKPPKPPKPMGYSIKVSQGKENQEGTTNITMTKGIQSKKEAIKPGCHFIGQKNNNGCISLQENNNSFEAVNQERHTSRRIIEAKPLVFHASTKTSSSNHENRLQQKVNAGRTLKDPSKVIMGVISTEPLKPKKLDIESGVGNSLLSSAMNRLAKNESNAIQAVSIDVPHSSVDKSPGSKPSCAERLGVGVQTNMHQNSDGERKIVMSHSFHHFPSGGTGSDKRMDRSELSKKPARSSGGSEGFVRKHVRQRSAPDANIKAWLKPEASTQMTTATPSKTVTKDDNSIQITSQQNSIQSHHNTHISNHEERQRKSAVHFSQESTSCAERLGIQTSDTPFLRLLRTERHVPIGTIQPQVLSNEMAKPAIPEKTKKSVILKKQLNDNVLKVVQHKDVLKSTGFGSKRNNDVIRSKDFQNRNSYGMTGIKPTDIYDTITSSRGPELRAKYTNTQLDANKVSHVENEDQIKVSMDCKERSIHKHDEASINSESPKLSVGPVTQPFTKQFKPVRFQPRKKKPSTSSTSISVCSKTSKANVENTKQLENLRHEKKVGHEQKAPSVSPLNQTQHKYHSSRSMTPPEHESQTAVKSIEHSHDEYTDDIAWKMLRSTQGNMLKANKLKSNQLNYVMNPVEMHANQEQDGNEYQQKHAPPTQVFNEYSLSGSEVSQLSSKSKSAMKPLSSGVRHRPYEYSLLANTDWTGKSHKQLSSVAPPTRSQANPECLAESRDDWRAPTHEYSSANSVPTEKNLLVFDCVNALSSVNQEGRIKQSTSGGQDCASTAELSRPICPINQHQHKKSYSSVSQTEYGHDIRMDRFFRPVVKRVNSWNDHVSRERRRDKDTKELYKKALKENKQKHVLNQQHRKISTPEREKQENNYTSHDGDRNVQFCNTKNVDKNTPTAKELLIIRTKGVKTYRKADEGNNNGEVLRKEQHVEEEIKVIDVDNSLVSRIEPQQNNANHNLNMQYNVQCEKMSAENELQMRQASVDEVHETLAKLNSSKNSSPSTCSNKNSRHFSSPCVLSHSIATSDISREVSCHTPTSHKKDSPDPVVIVDDNLAKGISTEKLVEATMTSVLHREEQSAIKARRNSKELFEKRNTVLKKEKPQFLDLKIEEKPLVNDTGSYNSLKRKQHLIRRNSWGSSSDVSIPQTSTPSRRNSLSELDTFFEQMGLDDNVLVTVQSPHELDDVFHTMYMEALNDDQPDADSDVMSEGSRVSESGLTKKLKKIPDNTSSIITRNAKVIKWLCQCKKAKTQL